ncbi:hypothetical protein DAI22_09g130700 [Oryza sativa Japonica Group]|nr:hypothetical protein DAI22_09g130700 [Oryza sativa Japonica Group]
MSPSRMSIEKSSFSRLVLALCTCCSSEVASKVCCPILLKVWIAYSRTVYKRNLTKGKKTDFSRVDHSYS